MRTRQVLVILALSVLCVSPVPSAQDEARESAIRALEELIPADAASATTVSHVNGFKVESFVGKELGKDFKPNGSEFQALTVSAAGIFSTLVEKGRPSSRAGGVAILHQKSGEPLLSASDENGDGNLDGLTYSVLDGEGKIRISVTDYGVDGQADLRTHFAERYFEIWHLGQWHRVEIREGRRGIVLSGKFVELLRENNRYYVP